MAGQPISNQKRHYQVERNYRKRLNEKIKNLAEVIPGWSHTDPTTLTTENSKSMVLEKAIAYITWLEGEQQKKQRALEAKKEIANSLHFLFH
ncbi:uncharacterized protein N7483_007362 [Penicillium malachiteum]|uniref:uncharacterized protein n=1 Tax=Penicillium malachiteum TaxID=1324776 RepID=UPI002548D25D|nr:uncharacterized protein N7483_007362 [Penicillium malachiteum]KAJ5726005.1 hypothetical protein N7483_007362 [Penicillium malachiteum]